MIQLKHKQLNGLDAYENEKWLNGGEAKFALVIIDIGPDGGGVHGLMTSEEPGRFWWIVERTWRMVSRSIGRRSMRE